MNPNPIHPLRSAGLAGLSCLLLSLAVPAASAQNAPATDPDRARSDQRATGPSRAKRLQERFLMRAYAGNQREIQLSELASSRATDPQVRSYAQELVNAHRKVAQELQPLLSAAGLDAALPSSSTGSRGSGAMAAPAGASDAPARRDDQRPASGNYGQTETAREGLGLRERWNRMLDDRKHRKLLEKTGEDFDEAYVELMVDEHQDAVDLFEDAAEDEDQDPQIRTFAGKHLPTLRQHLAHAERLEDGLD